MAMMNALNALRLRQSNFVFGFVKLAAKTIKINEFTTTINHIPYSAVGVDMTFSPNFYRFLSQIPYPYLQPGQVFDGWTNSFFSGELPEAEKTISVISGIV